MQPITAVAATSPVVSAASQADTQTVQGVVALEMQRKSVNAQAEAAARLLAALPAVTAPPPLAEEGPVGTQLNEVA